MKRITYIIALLLPLFAFAQFAPLSYEISTSRSLDAALPEERLSSSVIIDILADTVANYIWLGTGHGVSRITVQGGDTGRTYDFLSWNEAQGLGKGGISGLAVTDSIIWTAFAFDTTVGSSGAGGGMAYSRDNGATWTWFPQPMDRLYDVQSDGRDAVLGYWPTATNVDNVTYAIALSDSFVWSVSKGGGLRRHYYDSDYTDYNDTTGWTVVTTDSFEFHPLTQLNHRCFSVVYDGEALWVGSANGISKSTDEGKTWTRYTYASHGISGNFITALAYQEATGSIWAATWTAEGANEYYAVSKTDDGGSTWTVCLTEDQIEAAIGRRVAPRAHNFGFDGEIVYVCDDLGLWKSADGGNHWDLFPMITDSVKLGHQFFAPDMFAAYKGDGLLWAGGADGLAVSQSDGANWYTFQASLPVDDPARSTDTYAYPNPYSPQRTEVVRLRFTSPGGQVKVAIYDFSMTEVVKLPAKTVSPGDEYVVWDGRKNGKIVANGTYFYKIDKPGGEVWGKLIILD
jgi:hypothetical protein